MRICPDCGAPLDEQWKCRAGCRDIERLDGYFAFAPALAQSSTGFRREYFAELVVLEEKNFWFRSRNRLIVWALRCYFPDATRFLEVGCGTGYVLSGIKGAFPEMQLYGSEIYTAGLGFAAMRADNALLFQMDAREIPFKDEFDVIGAFDVLEHIEEDERVLQQFYRAVRPGGGIVLTVPQHPFLWSQHDEAACHARRYRRRELKQKVEAAGFEVKMTTSFVSLLLPFMLLSRLRGRVPEEHYDPMAELRLGPVMNSILEGIMNIERALTRWGIRFPSGGSLLLVAGKP